MRRIWFAVPLIVFVFLVSLPGIVDAVQKTVAKLQVKTLTLKGRKSKIVAKGQRPVVIKDSARVTRDLEVRGDIQLDDDGTVDGVDVSALEDTVNGISVGDSFPQGCSNGQVAKFDGDSWECGTDIDTDTNTDTNTTYSAGTGLLLTGTTFSLASGNYENVIVVAKSGGDFESIQEAIDSIEDAAEDNQYVVWVAPGTYEETLALQDYVHIVGANKNAVTISYDDSIFATPLVDAANGNVISDVTLEATATSLPGVAVYVSSEEDITLQHVDVSIAGAVVFNYAISNTGTVTIEDSSLTVSSGNLAYGIGGVGNLTMLRSTITVQDSTTSTGITIQSGSDPQHMQIDSSTIIATGSTSCYAFAQTGGSAVTATITDSVLQGVDCSGDTRGLSGQDGSVYTVRNSVVSSDDTNAVTYGASPTTMQFGSTQIDGGVSGAGGTVVCADSYDGSFAELDATCS